MVVDMVEMARMRSRGLMAIISVWEDERALESDGGNGCTTGKCTKCHQTVHLNMIKTVKFYVVRNLT